MTILKLARLPLILIAAAMLFYPVAASAAPVTWIGTDPSWTAPDANSFNATYNDGDAVTFDGTAVGYTVNIATTVSPGSIVINSPTTVYTFNSGDIIGATGISVSGAAAPKFNQSSLSFAGGTSINNARADFTPSTVGSHAFGTNAITLNTGGNSWFNYDPATTGTLTNDFIINGSVTWRNAGSVSTPAGDRPANPSAGVVRSGDVYLNGTLTLQIGDDSGLANCTANGCLSGTNLREHVILTGDRTIFGGERFYTTATTISGDISSQGVPRDLTLSHRGDNSDWEFFISATSATDPNGWNVKNIRRTSFSTANGTLVLRVNETQFFNNMTANGGSLFLTGGGMRFHDEFEGNGNSPTANINFSMVVDSSPLGFGTGFRRNSLFNVNSGGVLRGNGIYRSGPEGGAAFDNALDINVFTGGALAPGNPELAGGVGIMTINGDLDFNGGQLRIDVLSGNAVAGTDYDRLVVQDAPGAGSDGAVTDISTATLVIDFHNVPISALEGDVLTILTSSLTNFTGQAFGAVTTINAPEALGFDVIYGNGFIRLQDFELVVPEPSTFALLSLGAIGLVVRNRRRQRADN